MKNELFDHLIKSRVEAMKSEGKPNWERMSGMIDQWNKEEHSVSDTVFDAMIASKLKQSSVSYTDDNWSKLEKEIDRRRTIKQRIILFQLSSAAVFVLLAMLTFQLYPYFVEKNMSEEIVNSGQPPEGESVLAQGNTGSPIGLKVVPAVKKIEKISDTSVNEPALTNIPQTSNIIEQPAVGQKTEMKHFAGLTIGKMIETSNPRFFNPVDHLTGQNQLVDLNAFSVVVSYYEFTMDIIPSEILQPSNLQALTSTIPEKSDYSNDDDIENEQLQSKIDEIHEVKLQKSEKPEFYLAAYYNPALQFIQSPFDLVFNEPGYSLKQFNGGFGVLAGSNYKKFGLHTGLEYENIEYSPRKITETIEEGKSIYLKNIALKTIKVPIHLSFNMLKNKIWDVFFKAGVSVKAVLEANYELEENSNGLAYLIKDLKTNPSYVNSLYSKKSFESGLIEQGELVQNVASSADFGIGIKRQITKDAHAFVEPMIQIDLTGDGFGPNHDKIHNLHLKTGISVNLN